MTRDGDDEDPVPIGRGPRLKSLNEFKRPWWYPRFEISETKPRDIGFVVLVTIGLITGAAIGLILFD